MKRPIARLLLILLLSAGSVAVASEQSELLYSRGLVAFHAGRYAEALPLFDQAVAADAKDVYALYYRGVTQGRLGNLAAAVADLRSVLTIKPDLDQAKLELGAALAQSGAYKDALSPLQQAQAVAGLDAEASFFLALAQLRLGQLADARQNFERAAARDPGLVLSSRYYEGVVEYQAQNWSKAREHFDYVATANPNSEMGREAIAFVAKIRQGQPAAYQPYQLYGSFGFQYDSNVQLAPSDEAIKAQAGISKQSDGRAVMTVGGAYAPWQTEHALFSLGYEFFQSLHFSLNEFNLEDHRASAQVAGDAGPVRFGLSGRYDFYMLQTEPFLQEANAVPWMTIADTHGRTELSFRLRRRDYFKGPFDDSLASFHPSGVLDGFNYSPGVRRVFYVGSPERYVFVGYRFDREDPINAAGNAFAYDGNEIGTGVGWALPAAITAEADYAYRHEEYARESHGRRDDVHQVVFAADKSLSDHLALTLAYFGTISNSTDKHFEYDRNIVSLTLGVRF